MGGEETGDINQLFKDWDCVSPCQSIRVSNKSERIPSQGITQAPRDQMLTATKQRENQEQSKQALEVGEQRREVLTRS